MIKRDALIMLACGYLYGQFAGTLILIKNKNATLIGFLSGMAVLLSTAFLSGWTGFLQEGISAIGTADNPFTDYILIRWIE